MIGGNHEIVPPARAALYTCTYVFAPHDAAPCGGAAPALAQGTLQGRVETGAGVADVAVTPLHRVTRDSAGAVSASRLGLRRLFPSTLPPADTAGFTVFFATAEYQGVRYFGPPLRESPECSGGPK